MSLEKKTRDIHLSRKKMWDESMKNHLRYLDPNTGLFNQDFMEFRKCPVCAESNASVLFQKSGSFYERCQICGLVFLNPVMKDDHLEDYYRNNHQVQSEVVENDSAFYRSLYNSGLEIIENQVSPGDILDVGCSSGVFLDLAKTRRWTTHGIEFNELEAKRCAEKGHNVSTLSLFDLKDDFKFNAITMWDVFEHIKDGKTTLEKMKRHLAPGGVILLQIPSADALAARLLRQHCNMFDGLEHVNLYSLNSITKLASMVGFELAHTSTVISEIGVINNFLNYDDPYLGSTTNRVTIPAFGEIDEKFIHDSRQGYKYQLLLK
jgi:SAM-dependent methyltransferase